MVSLRRLFLLAFAVAFGLALSAMVRAVLEPWLGEGLLASGVAAAVWLGALWTLGGAGLRTSTPEQKPTEAPAVPMPDVSGEGSPDAPAPAYPRTLRQMTRRYQTLYEEAFARQSRRP